jgi:putative molybdopterin biosynthesis protein
MQLHLDTTYRIGGADGELIDPALVALLAAIAEGGSLRFAASQVGLSYRHAWGLLRHWETALGRSLADLERGRGARLTPAGQLFLETIRQTERQLRGPLDVAAAELEQRLHKVFGAEKRVRIAASHGVGIAVLRDLLQRRHEQVVDLHYFGSSVSLERYLAGECELAGFHLPEGPLAAAIAPPLLGMLDSSRDVFFGIESRQQGFMLRADLDFEGIADLARPGRRFINRQPGSGSRLIFDELLRRANVDPETVAGYQDEEHTHTAVAALICSGDADVGFGIRSVATRFGVGFLPQLSEQYYAVLAQGKSELVTLISQCLASPDFFEQLSAAGAELPPAPGRIYRLADVLDRHR